MKILWSELAILDLRNIRDYIANDSPRYAAIFVERIIAAVEKVSVFPLLGRIVPEGCNKNTREIIYQNYRIIYKITGKAIIILTVIHGGRNLYGALNK